MGDKQQSTASKAWNLATDNAVGGGVGALADMVQSGKDYGLLRTGEVSRIPGGVSVNPNVWQQSPTANGLGQLGDKYSRVAGAGKYAGLGMSALGLVGGGIQTAQGIGELRDGNYADGSLNTMAGLGSATSGGIGLAAGLGSTSAVGGTTAAGLGTSVAAAGALPVAATVGGGLAAGVTVGQRANSYISDTGLLGRNSDGSGRSWSDWAGDTGADAYSWAREQGAGETLSHVVGGATTLGASIAAVPGAAVTGIAGLATDAWDLATSW